MLGFGGGKQAVAKATAAALAARGALLDAEARRDKVREKLATAPAEDMEALAGEAARAAELVEAHRVRAEAADAARVAAEAGALEEKYRQAEATAAESAKRVRELGAQMTERARAFAMELVASARELEAEAAKGRNVKDSLPPGERQNQAPDASGISPWHGALYGGPVDVLRAASFVLSRRD